MELVPGRLGRGRDAVHERQHADQRPDGERDLHDGREGAARTARTLRTPICAVRGRKVTRRSALSTIRAPPSSDGHLLERLAHGDARPAADRGSAMRGGATSPRTRLTTTTGTLTAQPGEMAKNDEPKKPTIAFAITTPRPTPSTAEIPRAGGP